MKNEYPVKGTHEDSASKMRRVHGEKSNEKKFSGPDINPNKYTAKETSPKPGQ